MAEEKIEARGLCTAMSWVCFRSAARIRRDAEQTSDTSLREDHGVAPSEAKGEDPKNAFDLSISPNAQGKTKSAAPPMNLMRWFWIGLAVSIPAALLIGNDKHFIFLVKQFTILYMLFVLSVSWLYQKWNDSNHVRSAYEYRVASVTRILIFLGIALPGHMLGLVTIALFL